MNKYFFVAAVLLAACTAKQQDHSLSSVQIIDRGGMNETISSKDKLDAFSKVAFEKPQPYQKVVRVYKKDAEGKVCTKITTYHENGHIYQYLETAGGRAHGVYKEWFPNGKLRMQAHVIEGMGDLSEQAQASWVFDKESLVWNEDGAKIAEILYNKGSLEGLSQYFYPNGHLSKTIPYVKDQIHGIVEQFDEEGKLIGKTPYVEGVKHGLARFEGDKETPAREEIYQKGYLLEGKYYDYTGKIVSEIKQGFGKRKVFAHGVLQSEHEYKQGIPEGEVLLYREDGSLEGKYYIHHGRKEGEETIYYADGIQPMLCITWLADEIHGTVKTWYPNGKQESEREMHHNKKQGMAIAWYQDGSLMLVEDYDADILVSGKYLKKGEEEPLSRIIAGNGIATLFSPNGDFLRKVEYRRGKPLE